MASMGAAEIINSEFVHILPNHEVELCNRLYRQWQEGQHCDLVISLSGGEVRAHSCVLAAVSPKMKAILDSSAQYSAAASGLFIQLTFEEKIFRCLLNMMYTGVLSFNTALLSSVLSTARWMQMDEVVRLCQELKQDMGNQSEEAILNDETVLCEVNADNIKQEPALFCQSESHNAFQTETLDNWQESLPHTATHSKKERKRKRSGKGVSALPKKSRGRKKKDKTPYAADVIKQEPDSITCEIQVDASASNKGCVDVDGTDPPTSENTTTARRKVGRRRAPKSRKKNKSQPKKPSKAKTIAAPSDTNLSKSSQSALDLDTDKNPLSETEDPSDVQSDPHAQLVESHNTDSMDSAEADFTMGKTDHVRCKHCLRKFKDLDKFLNHMKNHPPAFQCDMCSITYYRQSNLTRHMRLRHSDAHHLRCRKCGFLGETEKKLRTHCKEIHGDDKPFACDQPGCSYSAWKYHFLCRHLEIHSEVKNYICNKCGQGFSQYAGLVSHHRTCYQLQQYLCDLCGQSFNHVQSMRAHRRTIHLGEKPYLCKTCGNQFSDQRNLKRHMRIHENVFPYQCPVCQQNYRHSNSLKAHMKKHGDLGLNIKLTALSTRQAINRKGATNTEKVVRGNMSGVGDGTFADRSDSETRQLSSVYESVSGVIPPEKLQQMVASTSHTSHSNDVLIPGADPLCTRALVEQLHPSANPTHSELFTTVPLIMADHHLDTEDMSSTMDRRAVTDARSPEDNIHWSHGSNMSKLEPLMSEAMPATRTVTSVLFNKVEHPVLNLANSGGNQSFNTDQSRTNAHEDTDRREQEIESDIKSKGQSNYGLQTLAEICFKSSV